MSGSERRQWPRIPASLLSNLTASIIAGPDVKLVNLSRGGALMEVAARYPMRSKVRLKLTRPDGGVTQVHGTVSWAKVASISNGKINYLLAVIFDSAIEDLSAATGIDDIESHASVAMVEDPFEGTEASAAALILPPVVPAADPVPLPDPISLAQASEPVYVEEDLSDAIFTDAGHVTSLPSSSSLETVATHAIASQATADREALEAERAALQSDLASERQRWEDERAAVAREAAEAVARAGDLQGALEKQTRDSEGALAEARALHAALEARLGPLEAERETLSARIDAERTAWLEDRSSLVAAIADAQARVADLERALQEHSGSQEDAIIRARAREQELLSRVQAVDAERNELNERVEQERNTWQEERQTLAAAAGDAQARVSQLESALHGQRDAQERALADARATHQELQARLDAHDAERNAWTDERLTLTSAVAAAQSRIADLEGTLHTQHEAHERALAEAHATRQELHGRLDAVDAERHQWHQDRAGLEAAAAATAAHVRELEASLLQQDHAHRQAIEEALALQQQLETRLAKLQGELSDWQAGREAERAAWREERSVLAQQADAAAARLETLEEELRARQDDHVRAVAEQQAAVLSLTARLEVSDIERLQVQRELADERSRRDTERAQLVAEATARTGEFEAALEAREQIHAEAMAREQARFEELIAELMQAANDQQGEYQQLMAERTAALEAQVSRVERVSAELLRVRTEAELHRTSLEARCRQLEARLQAAEAAQAAQEQRQREACREAERLVALLTAPAPDASAEQPLLFAAADAPAQAVA